MALYTDKIAAFENTYNDEELDDEQVMEKLDLQLLEQLTNAVKPILFCIKRKSSKEIFDLITDRILQHDFYLFYALAEEQAVKLDKIYE